MTMVPAHKQQQKQNYLYDSGYGGCSGGYTTESFGGGSVMSSVEGYYNFSESCLGSDLVVSQMAEDESRTNSVSLNEAEAGSSSKGTHQDKDEGSWLQLSIGCQTAITKHEHDGDQAASMAPTPTASALVELDLLPAGHSNLQQTRPIEPAAMFQVPEIRGSPQALISYPGAGAAGASSFSTSNLLFQHPASGPSFGHHHQEISWAFGPIPYTMGMPSSSSSSSLRTLTSYFPRPFQFPAGFDDAGPSSDVRVVDPPRRPHSGIWFMLQASQNQAKEPFLPQIPKSYLRIKDGRMTVRLLLKYLVNKLRLESESEIEIRCRGQQLLPFLTLQHVRDTIWSRRDRGITTSLSDSSTTDHIMVLHYGRCA